MPGVRPAPARRLPLIDRAQSLGARFDSWASSSLTGGMAVVPARLPRQAHDDVRLRADRAPDRVGLQTVHERRNENEYGNASRHAASDERRLNRPPQEPQREYPFERHDAEAFGYCARTRWPGSIRRDDDSSPALTRSRFPSARACVPQGAPGAVPRGHCAEPGPTAREAPHRARRPPVRPARCPCRPRRCRSRRSCPNAGTRAARERRISPRPCRVAHRCRAKGSPAWRRSAVPETHPQRRWPPSDFHEGQVFLVDESGQARRPVLPASSTACPVARCAGLDTAVEDRRPPARRFSLRSLAAQHRAPPALHRLVLEHAGVRHRPRVSRSRLTLPTELTLRDSRGATCLVKRVLRR